MFRGLIGFLATVIVVALTALATWYFTHKEAEDAETKRAIGASRLLASNLRLAEDRFHSSLLDCRYRDYDFVVSPPPEDLLLVAWRLDAADWATVSLAIDGANLQIRRGKEPHEFVQDDVIQLRYVIKLIDKARHALEEASQQKPLPEDEVKKELSAGTRC